MATPPKPIALIILDGWGHRDQVDHNPICSTATPTFDHLLKTCPNILIDASGEAVGLPKGQMGNSEVGHLHIGAGRKIPQDLTRIDEAIQSGEFERNIVLLNAIETAKKTNRAIHILGLLSPGGVHSHENQILALIKLIGKQGLTQNYFHAILDGRDTPPKSAEASIEKITAAYRQLPGGKIASIIGRYYAMDRDHRWQRIKQAYDLITQGLASTHANSAKAALEMAYARGETDEFVKASAIYNDDEKPITINDDDVVIFMNFRADRARQITHALTESDFNGFKRLVFPQLADFVTLTHYANNIKAQVAFSPMLLQNTLGEYLSAHGLKQLRIAETEKYAHVTYFINGGYEYPYPNEERILIPSPKVATYDLQPQMSAIELTDALIEAIANQSFDVIICNFANPDMVGHTGVEKAAEEAVGIIDQCMKRIIHSLKQVGGEALITADHGNIETMYNNKAGQPHTAHTTNQVPLIYYGRDAHFVKQNGALDDIAPTLLRLMDIEIPKQMTGQPLIKLSG